MLCQLATFDNLTTSLCFLLQGVIESVSFVSYGTPAGQCGAFVADAACDHAHATARVETACLGKTFCTVPVREQSQD